MNMLTNALAAVTAALLISAVATSAQAVTYSVESFDPGHHSVWIPGINQTQLHLGSDATLEVETTSWRLTGTLTSGTDASTWSIDALFTSVLTGTEFRSLTAADDSRVKGNVWANEAADWAFAQQVGGSLTKQTGNGAGMSYSLSRSPGGNDYWAQLGTGLNDKNDLFGLSTWLNLAERDIGGAATGYMYSGDVNGNVNPVPEPGASVVFCAGLLVFGAAVRNRRTA